MCVWVCVGVVHLAVAGGGHGDDDVDDDWSDDMDGACVGGVKYGDGDADGECLECVEECPVERGDQVHACDGERERDKQCGDDVSGDHERDNVCAVDECGKGFGE